MRPPRYATLAALAVAAIAVVTSSVGEHRAAAQNERPIMTVGTPLPVPRTVGRFDYLTVDEKYRRLLAVHTSSDELLVVSLDTGEVERRLRVGAGHGVAVDVYDGKIFVGTEDGYISQLNRRWLVENQRIYTNGPVGALTFDSRNGRLFAAHLDGSEDWVVQGKTDKLLQFPVSVAKGPQTLQYDPLSDRIYESISSTNAVTVIDPATDTVTATWAIAPATDPHGVAVDGKGRRLFVAGGNGKLAVLDLASGQVTQTFDIPARSDQIAYDDVANKLYVASGVGLLTVIGETPDGFGLIGEVPVPRGTHSLAIDPKTHNVWIAYGGDQNDYVLKISPPAAATASPAPIAQGHVTGTVTYLQRSALPAGATLHMQIDQAASPDTPAATLASVDIPVTHQVPIAFDVSYDVAKINTDQTYVLYATIFAEGKALFRNSALTLVITHNNPNAQIDLRVDPL